MERTPTEFLKLAAATAEHFGFRTAEELKRCLGNRACERLAHTITAQDKRLDAHHGLLIGPASTYCDERLHALETPVLLYGHQPAPRTGELAITFHIFNVEKSIGEAILIQACRSLLSDLGYRDHTVRINSLGDAESMTRYGRELTNFLKRRLDTMPPSARELMKEHALLSLMHLVEKEHELAYRSPNPLEFLSDQSRKHFREIVEYLDMSDTPYEIDPKMLGHHECYSDALFSISPDPTPESPEPTISIRGGRFDEFMLRRTKRRTPAVGAVVSLKNSKTPSRLPRAKNALPSVYVVQLGFGPKIQSLLIIERLRQAGVPVLHDLANDSLSAQLRDAEARGVKYVVIVGQKEFVEQTVILRDMSARNQEHIPHDALIRKLKRQALAKVA